MYPIIEFTGGDRRGKQTQTTLLQHVLIPSVRLEFPNYELYSGHIIQATLKEEQVTLVREDGREVVFAPKKHPEVFQLLQSINRVEMKERMLQLQHEGYVICDRYRNCAEAYGPVDGCDLRWLKNLLECHLVPDHSIIFVGTQLPKPGEKADINERNREFQDRVMANFRGLAALEPHKYSLLDIDGFKSGSPITSAQRIHTAVCGIMRERLGIQVYPLAKADIRELVERGDLRLPAEPDDEQPALPFADAVPFVPPALCASDLS